jgi:outer membrane biosynthesis protein TonB
MSKKGQREVSPFIGHELLYDYLIGGLDQERKHAVEEHLKFSRDAQLDLNKIQGGQVYAEKLSETVVSQPILDQLNSPTTYLTTLMQKSNFERWPVGLKWGLEALVVVSVIVVLLSVAPWEKIMKIGVSPTSKEIILAEATKEKTPATLEAQKKTEEQNSSTKYADEGAPQIPDKKVAAAKATPTPAPEAKRPAPETKSETKPAAKEPVKAAAAVAVAKEEAKTSDDEKTQTADDAKPQSGGFLYRGSIAITNIEMVGPKIKDKIMELGGRKAGDVELGWQKMPSSQYFHFTIPEAKYPELLTFLGEYGKVRIGKEKHPRVMPDGIVRLIITVDEAKP